ncbi:MAG: glycosyltransferase family A protein, partial [Planctomycetota bacterium]
MEKPLVSIVLCAYDAGPLLVDALRSVLRQTWPNVEVLLVDDGSTDGSIEHALAETAEEPTLSDGRCELRVLRQANAGKSAALNLALDELRGDFYAMQDADDVSAPNRIERQVAALLDNEQLAGVFCGYDLLIGQGP